MVTWKKTWRRRKRERKTRGRRRRRTRLRRRKASLRDRRGMICKGNTKAEKTSGGQEGTGEKAEAGVDLGLQQGGEQLEDS